MRLERILAQNVLGLHSADLALTAPITLIAGHNGAGKSSLADAISMALLGKPRRVDLKKDMGTLVTEGTKKAVAAVWADGEPLGELKLPSDTHAVNPQQGWQYLAYVLDAGLFMRGTSDDRRKLLFQLTGCRATPDSIEASLLERGADPAKVAAVKPLLLSGFPGACKEAKTKATEAKGAWRAITGETYGEKKAEGWEPELPTTRVDEQEIAASREQLKTVEADLDEAQQALGASRAARDNHAGLAQRIEQLEETACLLERRQTKLNRDQADLGHWQDQLAAAEAAASGGKQGLVHDLARHLVEWKALAERTEGVATKGGPATPWFVLPEMDRLNALLGRYTGEHGPIGDDGGDPELAKRVPEFRQFVESLTRAVQNDQRDIATSEAAAAQVAELKGQLGAAPTDEALANAEEMIRELRQKRDQLRAKVEALADAAKAISESETTIQKAAGHHADVLAWSLIGDALAPDGIPAEMLAKALSPINTSLEILARLSGWQPVVISSEMDVTYGGRLFGLLSESEQWRVNTLLALAIAQTSELRFVLLDRFDVLDLPSRGQLLGMLLELHKLGSLDSAIVCGTLKEKPAKLPPQIQAFWVERGQIEAPAQLKAAS